MSDKQRNQLLSASSKGTNLYLANALSIPHFNAYDRRFEFCLIVESGAVLLEFRQTLLSKFFLGG